MREYTFIGLVSLNYPLKAGVADAIQKCKKAGIKPILMTEDYKALAVANGFKAGVISDIDETFQAVKKREEQLGSGL